MHCTACTVLSSSSAAASITLPYLRRHQSDKLPSSPALPAHLTCPTHAVRALASYIHTREYSARSPRPRPRPRPQSIAVSVLLLLLCRCCTTGPLPPRLFRHLTSPASPTPHQTHGRRKAFPAPKARRAAGAPRSRAYRTLERHSQLGAFTATPHAAPAASPGLRRRLRHREIPCRPLCASPDLPTVISW